MTKHLAVTNEWESSWDVRWVSAMAGVRRGPLIDLFCSSPATSTDSLNSFDFRCVFSRWHLVSWNIHLNRKHTHNLEIVRGACFERGSFEVNWNAWRRYSFHHRPSGRPARSYMLRWGQLLSTLWAPGMVFYSWIPMDAVLSIAFIVIATFYGDVTLFRGGSRTQGGRRQWRYMGHNLDAWLLTRFPSCNTRV